MNSKFLGLNVNDFIKGVLMAVIGAVVTYLSQSFSSGNFSVKWTDVWHVAAISFVAYLVKNLFTNSAGQPLSKETK